jgi:isoquinoline 1-oxidoreductase beta subunit
MTVAIDRRQFLKASVAAGGALALEFSLPAAAGVLDMSKPGEHPEVTHWIVIHPDNRVVIRIARSEMGQGSMTGLAQLVAEELGCDWHMVSTEFASPNEHIKRHRIWGSMSTGGSAAIRTSQDYLRKSGAAAREMLVSAAAAQWKVPASECKAANGVISHGRRRVTYGRVAARAGTAAQIQQESIICPRA